MQGNIFDNYNSCACAGQRPINRTPAMPATIQPVASPTPEPTAVSPAAPAQDTQPAAVSPAAPAQDTQQPAPAQQNPAPAEPAQGSSVQQVQLPPGSIPIVVQPTY